MNIKSSVLISLELEKSVLLHKYVHVTESESDACEYEEYRDDILENIGKNVYKINQSEYIENVRNIF